MFAPRMRLRAFSLLELLVVVAVIVVLLAILLPALGKVRDRNRTAACLANLKRIGTALHLYAADNKDYTPPRGVDSKKDAPPGWGFPGYGPGDRATWSDQIMLGQYAGSTNEDNSAPEFRNTAVKRRSAFICPSDTYHEQGDVMNVSYGMGTNFTYVNPSNKYRNLWKMSKFHNHSTQMVVVDCALYTFEPGGWKEPYTFHGTADNVPDRNYNNGDPKSIYNWAKRHNGGGANVLFLDGAAHFFQDLKVAYETKKLEIDQLNEN
jgi:prepilin-type N-terminal cleavage/methylation domain-containing protein/prepilin-type processing-associated H-X9-DG protein